MKLYEFIDECLNRVGVEKVFGIPGSLIMPVWQNLRNKDIILCSHEQEASYVATGYSKISKKPACVITTGGVGTTNCISGIASANIDSVPLIFISGRTPIHKEGCGLRQEESRINRMFDSADILCSVTKKSICIDNIDTAPYLIWETIKMSVEKRMGAVHLSIPIDLQNGDISLQSFEFDRCESLVAKVYPEISSKPLFVIGWGCWMSKAYDEVYELAERVNAPVVVTSKAYCCIKKDHNMFLGKLGYGYNHVIDEFIKNYTPNGIVVFGSSLGEKDIGDSVICSLIDKIPVYVISNEFQFSRGKEDNIKKIETDELKEYISEITQNTLKRIENIELISAIKGTKNEAEIYWNDKVALSDGMAKCIEYINKTMDNKCVVTADAGNHLANAGALVTPSNCGNMFIDVGIRAMGSGICSTVGMAIADNTKRYIAITGDGCVLMNGNVMHLAGIRNLPITFVVFNNNSLGRVRVGQSITSDYRATDINNIDYTMYAKAFNLDTYKSENIDEFYAIFPHIIEKKGPVVIEVLTGKDEVPVTLKDNIY